MSTHKDQLKNLKGPDTFQIKIYKLADRALLYRKPIFLTLIPIIGIGAAIGGWQWYRGQQRLQLQADLATIELGYREEADKTDKEREKLHEKLMAMAPKKEKADPAKEPPLTPDQEKLQKQIEALKPDHTESTKKFLAFYQGHKTEAAGRAAALHLVKLYLEDRDVKSATPLLAEILQPASSETFDQLYVRMLYVSVLEEQGQFDTALAEVDKAIPLASDSFVPEVLLVKSRLLYATSKKKEALEALDALISKHETAPEAQKARALKALWK